MVIWRDEKIVKIPADQIELCEDQVQELIFRIKRSRTISYREGNRCQSLNCELSCIIHCLGNLETSMNYALSVCLG